MIRIIKFRGKRTDNGEWVYGDFIHGVGMHYGNTYILPNQQWLPTDCDPLDGYHVVPESIGQYTGLQDSKGKEIYEGDIVSVISEGERRNCEVSWSEGTVRFFLRHPSGPWSLSGAWGEESAEVIGNIHDNPILIKAK